MNPFLSNRAARQTDLVTSVRHDQADISMEFIVQCLHLPDIELRFSIVSQQAVHFLFHVR
jgi:hypothetical protein